MTDAEYKIIHNALSRYREIVTVALNRHVPSTLEADTPESREYKKLMRKLMILEKMDSEQAIETLERCCG